MTSGGTGGLRDERAAAAGSESILVSQISKGFPVRDPATGVTGFRRVLEDVSFTIPRGKFVVLFGPNASGKTTLLKIVAGLLRPDSGQVIRRQEPFTTDLIFQNYRESLFPWKTVLENIAFPLELQGVPPRERLDSARSVLDEIGTNALTSAEHRKYPYELSGGQQQLTAIARSLMRHPSLLLMDESFAALDHDTRYLMQDVVTRLWERMDFDVLFVSHSVWEAVYLADVVVLLSKRPATVLDVIDIPLPRPRNREVEYSREFFELRSRILRVFEQELYGEQ